ncbi:TVP38/TMEM64 family protein [Paenibacillus spiritus]|uniref:TVP38/TMEM64 family membrane protein n=1 Tax=Paenibacillus spiritus TaxID=2496557 RepID=A0A5J5GJQ8_9BACL|nr:MULTISPECIES: TVP38/TMEM64 family protein [Paenibacillus]KAA9008395.1 TVP38/TMEM64 family protein [Paenibacillus spiritus]
MFELEAASWLTEDRLRELLEQYRSLGPLPGLLLTFMKSFVPPLPTVLIVGLNAAVYGLWPGFLYSWIGLVAGCLATFAIIRGVASQRHLRRWAARPRVAKAMKWVRESGFSYVFLLSLFPVGPFVIVNLAAGLAGMRLRSYLLAVLAGKGIMVLAVSYIGSDAARFAERPFELIYVVLFVLLCLWAVKSIERYFSRKYAGGGGGKGEP